MTFKEACDMLFAVAPRNICGNAARDYLNACESSDNDRDRATEILYAHSNISLADWNIPIARDVKFALSVEYTRLTGVELVLGETIDENGNQL